MQEYFHANTSVYKKRCRFIIVLICAPLAMVAVLAILILILNFRQLSRDNYVVSVGILAGAAILVGMNVSWLIWEITGYFVRRQSRYTFVDIGIKEVVFSRYAGQYKHFGKKTTRRKLYVIPLDTLESVKYLSDDKQVFLKGKIRMYEMDSDRLGYHISDGKVVFNNWWLNENGYILMDNLTLPKLFSRPKSLAKCIIVAKKRLERLPEPKKFEIKNPVVFRRSVSGRKKHYSNKYEVPTFNRSW